MLAPTPVRPPSPRPHRLLGALFFLAALRAAPAAGAQPARPPGAPRTSTAPTAFNGGGGAIRTNDDAYIAIVHLRTKPERRNDFIAAVRTLVSQTAAEPGFVRYELATWSRRAARPLVAHTPLGRLGRPEDVADAAVWLCSDEARFVTGQSLLVDGGFTIPGVR